jgi:endonuclease YncB( thermonuclease family)
MKQIYLLLALSIFFFTCGNKSNLMSQTFRSDCNYTVRVTGIMDGDTFKGLTSDSTEIRFRIYGIDAPEKKQAFSNKSKQYLSDLIFGKIVGIKIQKKSDKYRRPVVWVYTAQGQDVGAEMLKAGLAWHFKRFDSSDEYENYELQAQKQKAGLWQDDNPVAPWDFRAKKNKP